MKDLRMQDVAQDNRKSKTTLTRRVITSLVVVTIAVSSLLVAPATLANPTQDAFDHTSHEFESARSDVEVE